MLLMLMRGALCRVEGLGYKSVGVDGDGVLAGGGMRSLRQRP